jgi:hypothetical protein
MLKPLWSWDIVADRNVRAPSGSKWLLDAARRPPTIGRMNVGEKAVRVAADGWKLSVTRGFTSFAALLVWVLGLQVLAAESEKVPAEENKQAEVLAEFKIEKGGRAILLPVRIQEQEYLFMLDTGADHSLFDVSLRKFLGKPIEVVGVHTAAEPIRVESFGPPEAFLGNLDLREGGLIGCTDLEKVRRVMGKEVRGALGMGFLKKYVVRIDFDSGKVQFRAWDGRSHPEWGSAVYLYDAGGGKRDLPYAKGNPAGVGDMKFLVDSGRDAAGDLVAEVFEKAMDKKALAEGSMVTGAGTGRFRKTRISHLAFGGFEHRGLVMVEGNENLIGLGLLSRYVVTLDFPSMKMYLQKGQAFDKPDEDDMSGLHLWLVEGRTVVHSVDESSPAEAAGIRPEDMVLKVGETSATETDIEDLRDLLKSGNGKEITMTIRRREEEKAVTFKLKKQI